jgi:hypothetical protein
MPKEAGRPPRKPKIGLEAAQKLQEKVEAKQRAEAEQSKMKAKTREKK